MDEDDGGIVADPQLQQQDNNICENIFKHIKTVSNEDVKGPPIENEWSKIINKNWEAKSDRETMKKLREQYPVPENCNLMVPRLNIELWQMLSSLQRKSDVKFAQIQRNLSALCCCHL